MIKNVLIELYVRELNKLKTEINLYPNDENLWLITSKITNSAGNLALHLLGNLNHFLGAVLHKNGYLRDRDSEFSAKNISREELCRKIDETIKVVKDTLENLSDEDFEKHYPPGYQWKDQTIDFVLVSLLGHFNYHLGQINYHRRLLS